MSTRLKDKSLVLEKISDVDSPQYAKVVLLNDDYTPMDFVVHVLESFFAMNKADATKIMMDVHLTGRGICGLFPLEIAETKSFQINEYAQRNQHPLLSMIEKE